MIHLPLLIITFLSILPLLLLALPSLLHLFLHLHHIHHLFPPDQLAYKSQIPNTIIINLWISPPNIHFLLHLNLPLFPKQWKIHFDAKLWMLNLMLCYTIVLGNWFPNHLMFQSVGNGSSVSNENLMVLLISIKLVSWRRVFSNKPEGIILKPSILLQSLLQYALFYILSYLKIGLCSNWTSTMPFCTVRYTKMSICCNLLTMFTFSILVIYASLEGGTGRLLSWPAQTHRFSWPRGPVTCKRSAL